MARVKKFIPTLFFLLILSGVIYYLEPPKTIYEASWQQLVYLFGPLSLLVLSLYNLYFKFIWYSLLFTVSTVLLIALYLLGNLNILTGVLTMVATLLIYRSILRHQSYRRGLPVRIPRLSKLEKQR